MAVIHRALLTWSLFALFIVFLVLKLEGKSDWDWFLVFVPMWIFDSIVILLLALKTLHHPRGRNVNRLMTRHPNSKTHCAIFIISKLAFQMLLCIRLQYVNNLPLFIIMIPLWIFFMSTIWFFSMTLFTKRSTLL